MIEKGCRKYSTKMLEQLTKILQERYQEFTIWCCGESIFMYLIDADHYRWILEIRKEEIRHIGSTVYITPADQDYFQEIDRMIEKRLGRLRCPKKSVLHN